MQLQRFHHVKPYSPKGHVQISLTAISTVSQLDGNVGDYVKLLLQGPLLLVYVKSEMDCGHYVLGCL
jgi:hypothetical protein